MENWNPIGWSLLIGGFMFGVIVGWTQAGDRFWLVSYTTMLAGLAILVTNLIRALWRFMRNRKVVRGRFQTCLPKGP
jgi:O-antigen/teichoic acid export membrane protein